MDKTKKIIAIVAAALVILGTSMGVGYKLWFGEDMPTAETVETEVVVEDTVVTAVEDVVDVVDTVVAE